MGSYPNEKGRNSVFFEKGLAGLSSLLPAHLLDYTVYPLKFALHHLRDLTPHPCPLSNKHLQHINPQTMSSRINPSPDTPPSKDKKTQPQAPATPVIPGTPFNKDSTPTTARPIGSWAMGFPARIPNLAVIDEDDEANGHLSHLMKRLWTRFQSFHKRWRFISGARTRRLSYIYHHPPGMCREEKAMEFAKALYDDKNVSSWLSGAGESGSSL